MFSIFKVTYHFKFMNISESFLFNYILYYNGWGLINSVVSYEKLEEENQKQTDKSLDDI